MENKSNKSNESKTSNISINVLIAQAKQEYINTFNILNEKYNLPASIWSMILNEVLIQVNEIGKQDLARDLEALRQEQEDKLEEKVEDDK